MNKFLARKVIKILLGLIVLFLLAPLFFNIFYGFSLWNKETLSLDVSILFLYSLTTVILCLSVGFITMILGSFSAWLVTTCDFFGRKFFEWALILPFVIPSYIIAYIYTDLLDYSGPIQQFIRYLGGYTGATEYYFPEIRSLGGAIFVLSIILYSYNYLICRATFLKNIAYFQSASRSLGLSSWQIFFKISIPLAFPSIMIGFILVCMNVISDFGTVEYFAVPTLSLGIYDLWINHNNFSGAIQLASFLIIFIAIIFYLEKLFYNSKDRTLPYSNSIIHRYNLNWKLQVSSFIFCFTLVFLGFLLPIIILVRYTIENIALIDISEFLSVVWKSFSISLIASICTVSIGMLLTYAAYRYNNRFFRVNFYLTCLGYSLPGTVLAVGVLLFLTKIDHLTHDWLISISNFQWGLVLSSSVFAIIIAYIIRYISISNTITKIHLGNLNLTMDNVARSIGYNDIGIIQKIHFPLLKKGILTTLLIVFVDCIKELPATLLLRPLNFETLATKTYQYASDEFIEYASIYALSIVIIAILPSLFMSNIIIKSRF